MKASRTVYIFSSTWKTKKKNWITCLINKIILNTNVLKFQIKKKICPEIQNNANRRGASDSVSDSSMLSNPTKDLKLAIMCKNSRYFVNNSSLNNNLTLLLSTEQN